MIINQEYNLNNEILDELYIGTYCLSSLSKEQDKKTYKIYTLNYLNYLEHLIDTIKYTFNNKMAYNINNEFIDESDLKKIAFNMLFIMLHHNSKGSLFNYVTSIFEYEYSFNILTKIVMLENDLNMFLEKELDMNFFVLDIFNIKKKYYIMDLIVRGQENE